MTAEKITREVEGGCCAAPGGSAFESVGGCCGGGGCAQDASEELTGNVGLAGAVVADEAELDQQDFMNFL